MPYNHTDLHESRHLGLFASFSRRRAALLSPAVLATATLLSLAGAAPENTDMPITMSIIGLLIDDVQPENLYILGLGHVVGYTSQPSPSPVRSPPYLLIERDQDISQA